MATASEMNAGMEAKLKELGLGFESIQVFGVIRQNVHVKCVSRETAAKWAGVLAKVFKGAKVSTVPTSWEAKENNGTNLLPTMRKGFLVAVSA